LHFIFLKVVDKRVIAIYTTTFVYCVNIFKSRYVVTCMYHWTAEIGDRWTIKFVSRVFCGYIYI